MNIFEAIENNDLETVKQIVADNKNVLETREPGDDSQPLFFAISENKLEIVKYLIAQGAKMFVESGGYSFVLECALYVRHQTSVNNLEVIKYLIKELQNNKEEQEQLFFALEDAAAFNFVDVAKLILQTGMPLNYRDGSGYEQNLLLAAAEKNNLKFVKFLFNNNYNYEIKNRLRNAYQAAQIKNCNETVVYLKNFIKKNSLTEETTALFIAIKNNDIIKVQELIKQNHNIIDEENYEKLTPLCFALYYKKYNIAEFLINSGADVKKDCGTYSKQNPLIYIMLPIYSPEAIPKENCKILKLMIAKGADVKHQADELLSFAEKNKYSDIIKILHENNI